MFKIDNDHIVVIDHTEFIDELNDHIDYADNELLPIYIDRGKYIYLEDIMDMIHEYIGDAVYVCNIDDVINIIESRGIIIVNEDLNNIDEHIDRYLSNSRTWYTVEKGNVYKKRVYDQYQIPHIEDVIADRDMKFLILPKQSTFECLYDKYGDGIYELGDGIYDPHYDAIVD